MCANKTLLRDGATRSPRAQHSIALALVALALLLPLPAARSRADDGYELAWFTVDGGGGRSSGGAYALSGTIGQFDAGAQVAGGEYSLVGGFWAGTTRRLYPLHLPLVLR
jgi:hypothetical protein